MGKDALHDAANQLQALCDAGEATCGLHASVARGGIDLERSETSDAGREERFRVGRLTPLDPGNYGLAIVRHTGRLERVPFAGTIAELHEVMECELAHIFGAL